MKLKVFALSMALLAGAFSASAQGSDVFVGIGGGVISNYSDHFNAPAVYGQIQVGKYITPAWGVRAVIGGPFQKLDAESLAVNWASSNLPTKQLFGELNVDGMINFSQLWSKASLPKVDFYAFMGPSMNFSKAGSKYTGEMAVYNGYETPKVVEDNSFKVRVGATVGLGLAYNFTNKLALGIEGRFAVTPSIFGPSSVNSLAQGNLRGTLNLVYTIGGKSGKDGYAKKIAEAAGYISPAAAAAMVADALAKNPKIVEKPVEKIVYKEVEKKAEPLRRDVFFTINSAKISSKEMKKVEEIAMYLNISPSAKVAITGYADKGTGNASINKSLSERRAAAVVKALKEKFGIDESRISFDSKGDIEQPFEENNKNRVSICIAQ